jgi:hypothetical protein
LPLPSSSPLVAGYRPPHHPPVPVVGAILITVRRTGEIGTKERKRKR